MFSCLYQQITKFFIVTIFTDEMMEEIKVLELFSGIGGMHRAAQLAASYLPRIKLKVVLSSPSVLEGKIFNFPGSDRLWRPWTSTL